MLTRKQHQLLLYIDDHLKRTGFSPSFDEMKDALELRSKSGIHRLISALEERGFLRRHHHRARALEVVKMPPMPSLVDTSNLGANADPALGGHSNVVQARFGSAAGAAGANDVDGPVSLPSMDGSPQACRSKRCVRMAIIFRFQRISWATARITRWKSRAIQ